MGVLIGLFLLVTGAFNLGAAAGIPTEVDTQGAAKPATVKPKSAAAPAPADDRSDDRAVQQWSTAKKQRQVYNESKASCELFPAAQIAREYGIAGASDPIVIAKTYADKVYVPVLAQSGFEGCLDGLLGK